MMARLQPDTVDKLIDLLSLPVGENQGDERPEYLEPDIRRVSQGLGRLVFEDDRWFDYDATRVEDILANWLDDETAEQFDAAAESSQPPEFLGWVDGLVTAWTSSVAETAQALGLPNPDHEPYLVPGTEFYRYRNDEYVYAATADAADDQWATLEARYDEHRAAVGPDEAADGLLRGYPDTNSVIAGTAFYREEGETYLYGPKEFGTAEEWKPYEYWQQKADEAAAAADLIRELDSFIALIEARIAESRQ